MSRVLTLAIIVIVFSPACRPQREKQETRLAQAVAVITVQKTTVRRTIQLLGTLEGERQVMAMSKVAGRVTEIVRPEGSTVSEGEPIAYVVNDIPGMDYKPGPVLAPVSGTVGKVYVEVGQTVAPTMPVAVVSSFSSTIKARALVSDADLRFVRTGATARVSVSAVPDTVFLGRVSRVTPMVDPLSRSATVELSIPNTARRLVPGMTASIRLLAEEKQDVVALPLGALFTDGFSRVVVIKDRVAHFRDIKTGLVGDSLVEVVTGLEPGEKVATTGKERVRDGETVNPVEVGQ
ncbi:MAG: efflux RND transporter periplasmic adaptor subunit [candidate division WOR-3 bacterium]